ncbi:MAG: hypothetical protein Q8K12_16690 [Thiobacillus sp.]|nr:hypothetical protein [Thiobacillus sp.]
MSTLQKIRAIAGLRLNLQAQSAQKPGATFLGEMPHLVFVRTT